MKTRFSGIACIIALVAAGCAADAPPRAGDGREAAIIARSRALFEAEGRNDRPAIASFLAEDFVYLSSNGRPDRPKAEEIALQGDVTVETFSMLNERVRFVSADIAALHYLAHQRLRKAGRDGVICPYSGAMELWRHDRGRWLMVSRTEWLISWDEAAGCGRP